MVKCMNQITRIWKDNQIYLQMVMVLFFLLPIGYFAYLSMSASMLNSDIMTLLTNSAVEGVNLIVNISMFYGAYVIKVFLQHENEKSSCIAFVLLLLAQLLFLNPFTCFLLMFYISRFIGFKQLSAYYHTTVSGINWKVILPALLVLVVSILTLILKFKLQMVF